MENMLEYDLTPYIEQLYNNITFETVIKFMIVYFFIIWIALLIWVTKDIVNRTTSVILQIISILIILLWTPLGIFIYLLIRPSKTLFEKYHNEVEWNLDVMEWIIEEKNKDFWDALHCFSCESPILPAFKFCPTCKTELKVDCKWCEKHIYKNWKLCPYCGEEQNYEIEKIKIIKKEVIKKSEKVHDEILEIVNHVKHNEEKIKQEKTAD
jgi:hypothetical protein